MGYAFVDDSDLVETLKEEGTFQDLIKSLQDAVNSWEGSLSATSGAIIPQKSYWYLVELAWSGVGWRYKRVNEYQGDIKVRNIDGKLETLKWNEVDFAEETLGIHMASDGNRK